jgi:hypothetical protein
MSTSTWRRAAAGQHEVEEGVDRRPVAVERDRHRDAGRDARGERLRRLDDERLPRVVDRERRLGEEREREEAADVAERRGEAAHVEEADVDAGARRAREGDGRRGAERNRDLLAGHAPASERGAVLLDARERGQRVAHERQADPRVDDERRLDLADRDRHRDEVLQVLEADRGHAEPGSSAPSSSSR